MSFLRPRSLKWRLVTPLVIFETVLMTLFMALAVGTLWTTGVIVDGYEGGTLDVLKDAIVRDGYGELRLKPTPELAKLRAEAPELWFVIRDVKGYRLSEGAVPKEFAPLGTMLDHVSDARLTWSDGRGQGRPDALVKWQATAAGDVQIFSGTHGRLSFNRLLDSASSGYLTIMLPLLALMAVAAFAVTPLVVRRALRSLGAAADAAERIDIDRRGVRLPLANVPHEIAPLVQAVNAALGRLDQGYEKQQRFLVDAAHELRTPIAILNARLALLPVSPIKTRLTEDAVRLSTLAGQLLDRQRLDEDRHAFAAVDLVTLTQRVVADLAPLAFAAGYEISFDHDCECLEVRGDASALERALTNLVQNAIDHGGRHGTIAVRVLHEGWIEVADEGEGIPHEEREHIFEPFHRLRADGRGTGLGLNLVQEILRLHGARVAVVDTPIGACLRMVFPLLRGLRA
jgi:signal transduction histidine kinase